LWGLYQVIRRFFSKEKEKQREPEKKESDRWVSDPPRGKDRWEAARPGGGRRATSGSTLLPWVLGGVAVLLLLLFFGAIGGILLLLRPSALPASPPSPVPPVPSAVDLTGNWTEPGGYRVSITQQGKQITMRMLSLEQLGLPASMTTLTGTVEESSPGGQTLLRVTVFNQQGMKAEFHVLDRGNRLEGTVWNGLTRTPAVLHRQGAPAVGPGPAWR
jgi:hypothetical protein